MIIKENNDRSAETVFTAFRNVDGAGSITSRTAVCFTVDGNSATGFPAIHSRTAAFPGFGGLAQTSVAINGYGLMTSWGNHASVLISNEGTSITITAGNVLTLVDGTGFGMSSVGGVTLSFLNGKTVIQTTTLTVSAAGYADNVFVRAL